VGILIEGMRGKKRVGLEGWRYGVGCLNFFEDG